MICMFLLPLSSASPDALFGFCLLSVVVKWNVVVIFVHVTAQIFGLPLQELETVEIRAEEI